MHCHLLWSHGTMGTEQSSYMASSELTHLHGGRNEGGHEQGALWRREVLCQLELPLGDLQTMLYSCRSPSADCIGRLPSTRGKSAVKHS